MSFNTDQSFAFVMSPRLGDSLLSMVVVHNLLRGGYRVTVFSRHIDALRQWFPHVAIESALTAANAVERLNEFDVVLHAYHADKVLPSNAFHSRVIVMDDWPVYRQVKNMVDIQTELCEQRFGVNRAVRANGLLIPDSVKVRCYPNRVIIHPIASDAQKSWLPMRFVKLALWLKQRGFEPEFLLPPEAQARWHWLEHHGFTPHAYDNLGDVASRIAESGWVIGNDSGIGHLASNLGIPTVSLAMRRRIAQRWRPGWAPSRAVIAPPLLPSRFLKERFWKYLLSTSRVMSAFDALMRDCGSPRIASALNRAGGDLSPSDTVVDVRHAG